VNFHAPRLPLGGTRVNGKAGVRCQANNCSPTAVLKLCIRVEPLW
jgi:hypothetical protein